MYINPVPKDFGKRIDAYIAEYFRGKYSRTYLQKLISCGLVLVNNKPCKPNHKIGRPGQIYISFPQPEACTIKAEDIPLEIIYEDKDLLVINKPAGMVTHPGAGRKSHTLVNALLHHCKDLSGIGGVLRPGIVHRLDKDTSGIMLVAKTDSVHRELAKQFKERKVGRKYMALVEGVVELDNDQINLPVGRHPKDRQMMAVQFAGRLPAGRQAKDAVTQYKVLKRFSDSTLLEITPVTGRTHQIRVHMKAIGHPIVGDTKYGSKNSRRYEGGQMLHACRINFFHPVLKKYMDFFSKAPF